MISRAAEPKHARGAHGVLVVEDDQAIRELLVEFLEAEGFATDIANDGEAAIRLVAARPPLAARFCVVVLDLMLEKASGFEVLACLQRETQRVPVLVVSASPQHLADATAAGADEVLAKPFDISQFLDQLRQLVALRCGQVSE